MFRPPCIALAFTLLALTPGGCQSNPKDSTELADTRAETRADSERTLSHLYSIRPSARRFVEGAAGYATFDNCGMKILLAGGGTGRGLAINNATGGATYMRMAQIQAGLGVGISEHRLVWVFDTQQALSDFINSGWEFGGSATAAAMVDNRGIAGEGALAVSPGVWLFQLTDTGLALELTAKGTKYYKDDGLN